MRVTLCRSITFALMLLATACGSSMLADSTRQVLPEFRAATLEHKNVFVAPYFPTDVDTDGTYPVSQALILSGAAEFAGVAPETAMAMRLVRIGAAQVRSSFHERNQQVNVTTLPTERWLPFQAEPEHYLNVSVDGTTRYNVPKPEPLKAFGLSADYVIVLGALHFGGGTTISSHNGVTHVSREINCKARFLVFGYAESRVLAEGTVNAMASHSGEPQLPVLETLMSRLYEEIVAKPPFRN